MLLNQVLGLVNEMPTAHTPGTSADPGLPTAVVSEVALLCRQRWPRATTIVPEVPGAALTTVASVDVQLREKRKKIGEVKAQVADLNILRDRLVVQARKHLLVRASSYHY